MICCFSKPHFTPPTCLGRKVEMAKSITIFSNGDNKTYAVPDERYDIMVDRSRNILKEAEPDKAAEYDEMNGKQILKHALCSPEYNGWNKATRHTAFSIDPYDDDDDDYIPQDHDALLIDHSENTEEKAERRYFEEEYEEIVHALLPRSEADVYILQSRYNDYDEVAEKLCKSYNAVEKLYRKAEKRLKAYNFKTLDDFYTSEQYANPKPFKERGMKS